jgi:predicted membrane protein
MKKYANIVLLAILTALFYKTPSFLIESVSSPMGKLAWMVIIFIVYQMLDKVSAVILAIIMITLLHQTVAEGFKDKKEDGEKTQEEELVEMEEKETETQKKTKKTNKSKKADKGMENAEKDDMEMENAEKDDMEMEKAEEDDMEMENAEETGKEGFELVKKSKKECETYDKEGFTGFTELLKKFKIPITTTNTTDLDRELKVSSERSTLDSSKEF